jgi:hypothetical protein
VDQLRLAHAIMNDETKASPLDGVENRCADVIRSCWTREPEERPTASNLIAEVSTMLMRECVFGLHQASLTDGVECSALEELHFACIQCVEGEMR